ncbi:MAG: hypothetical protein GY822_19345 [Deltaproteobacteria bacterium]|nr:hypothetical protein [Deltaproteobacteria bacterium]
MNYLCHARNQTNAWRAVGTLLPDFLSMFRASRLRPRKIASEEILVTAAQKSLREGVLLHFKEDAWFHTLPVFTSITGDLTSELREVAEREAREQPPRQRPFRAHFFAHILLEMLLDAAWEEENQGATEKLYEQLGSLSFSEVEKEVHAFLRASEVEVLPPVAFSLKRFVESGLLFDYHDDERILFRLEQVGSRVRQPPLHVNSIAVIRAGRPRVRAHLSTLLTSP